MRVLITGATGFLGEWVARACFERGYEIHILCRETSDLSKIQDLSFTKHIGDLDNIDSLCNAMDGIDLVIHMAGKIAYERSAYQAMWKTNVEGTRNVLEAMNDQNIKQMIYLSSVVAIGASKTPEALNEDSSFDIADLELGYFDSKHAAEKLVLSAYEEGWLKPVIINPSTIYGPGDMTKGSRKTQLKVAKGKFPFYTSGGVNVVHVKDVVDLMFLAFDKEVYGKRIIAAGENVYIKTLFQWIAEVAGTKKPSIYLPNVVLFTIAYIGAILSKFGVKGPINIENAYTASMFHWFDNSYAKSLGMEFQPSKKAVRESITWAKENGLL